MISVDPHSLYVPLCPFCGMDGIVGVTRRLFLQEDATLATVDWFPIMEANHREDSKMLQDNKAQII